MSLYQTPRPQILDQSLKLCSLYLVSQKWDILVCVCTESICCCWNCPTAGASWNHLNIFQQMHFAKYEKHFVAYSIAGHQLVFLYFAKSICWKIIGLYQLTHHCLTYKMYQDVSHAQSFCETEPIV